MPVGPWGTRLGWTCAVAAGAAVLGVAGAAVAGTVLARLAVSPARRPGTPVVIEDIERDGASLLARLRGPDADLPGRYSFLFDEAPLFGEGSRPGHARLGPVRERRGGSIVRPIVAVDRGTLSAGTRGRLTGWWYEDPAELGFETETIEYPTELGDARAWLVRPRRARKKRWAVHVHGRGALPAEAIRGVAPLARAGITSLVISYRNDPGAPRGMNGRYGNGVAETRDVDAAIAEALRRGAERVTLFGWSMGGTACLLSATEGPHRDVVDGLILDSPAVDWASLLRHQAAGYAAPRGVADLGIRMLGRGLVRGGEPGGIDFARLTPDAFARKLTVPVLVHASRGDRYVPCEGAERLAEARPDLVQLRLQDRGGHVRLWNVDPDAWKGATEQFARALPRPPWRG